MARSRDDSAKSPGDSPQPPRPETAPPAPPPAAAPSPFVARLLLLRAPPTAPQQAFLYAALCASMLAGAAVAHEVLKPDLRLPRLAQSASKQ